MKMNKTIFAKVEEFITLSAHKLGLQIGYFFCSNRRIQVPIFFYLLNFKKDKSCYIFACLKLLFGLSVTSVCGTNSALCSIRTTLTS